MMLKLELPPAQKTRPPPAPAFSAPFTSPALKWARRKRHHHFSTALPHSRRRQRQRRGASSSPDPTPNDEPSLYHHRSDSPSPSPAPHKNNAPILPRTPRKEDGEDDNGCGDAVVRPRTHDKKGVIIVGRRELGKPVILALAAASRDDRNGTAGSGGVGEARSLRPRVAAGGARRRRVELWVSLSREEIEEDYYSITGGRLPRRPKRRPRTLPPNLADRIFPGSWLPNTIMAEMYKVHDPAVSKRR